MSAAISLKNIAKTFRDADSAELAVLKNIDLEIKEGEFFIILGPSGSGKSTLLRIMSGLEKNYAGELRLAKNHSRSDFSFVFQQFALLPWLSVYQNIEMGLLSKKFSAKERNEIVAKELKEFGLEKFANTYPKELSGGMRQRVGIARALAPAPKIIFMDEPFSELDSFTAEELRHELLRIWLQRKLTVIMVTHLIDEALELADRVAVLTPLPGRIEKIIEMDFPRPRDKRSSQFYSMYDALYKIVKP